VAWRAAAASTVGLPAAAGGRERNEDNYLLCQGEHLRRLVGGLERVERVEPAPPGVLAAVCDGMGGHDEGDRASELAIAALAELWRAGKPGDPMRALVRGVREAHAALYWKERERGPVRLGTTLTAAWLVGQRVAFIHVGDSRLYRWRAGEIERWTVDHTRNEFARRDGHKERPDWERLCQNFLYGSRGLGDNTSIRLDAGVDYSMEEVAAGDRLLLCSDGLGGVVSDARMAEILGGAKDPADAVAELLKEANICGSRDNVTAVSVWADVFDDDTSGGWLRDDTEETFQF
jgi:protein phosphatase